MLKHTIFCRQSIYPWRQDETQEILDSILPPREWEEDGKLWRQSVSSTPATRLDVMNLQEQLDLKLQQRQARETGICQVMSPLKQWEWETYSFIGPERVICSMF